jgi:hypothetical protein
MSAHLLSSVVRSCESIRILAIYLALFIRTSHCNPVLDHVYCGFLSIQVLSAFSCPPPGNDTRRISVCSSERLILAALSRIVGLGVRKLTDIQTESNISAFPSSWNSSAAIYSFSLIGSSVPDSQMRIADSCLYLLILSPVLLTDPHLTSDLQLPATSCVCSPQDYLLCLC